MFLTAKNSNFWTVCGRLFASQKAARQFFKSLPTAQRYELLKDDPNATPLNYGICGRWFKTYLLHIVDGHEVERKLIRFSTFGEMLITCYKNEKN